MVTGGTQKGRRRPGHVAVAILSLLAVSAFLLSRRPGRELDPSKLATVEKGDLARSVVATGKIQPLAKVEVKSKASGIVKKLMVDYGEALGPDLPS